MIETALLESSFNLILGGIVAAFALEYGIASRDVLANMISALYSRNKYKEGQIVKLDDGKGIITRIGHVSVTIQNAESITVLPFTAFSIQEG